MVPRGQLSKAVADDTRRSYSWRRHLASNTLVGIAPRCTSLSRPELVSTDVATPNVLQQTVNLVAGVAQEDQGSQKSQVRHKPKLGQSIEVQKVGLCSMFGWMWLVVNDFLSIQKSAARSLPKALQRTRMHGSGKSLTWKKSVCACVCVCVNNTPKNRFPYFNKPLTIWGFPKMVVPNNHGFSY